jgi:hypothetical protein
LKIPAWVIATHILFSAAQADLFKVANTTQQWELCFSTLANVEEQREQNIGH